MKQLKVCSPFHEIIIWWQSGVEADLHANYVSLCVVKLIGVEAKSGNVHGSQN